MDPTIKKYLNDDTIFNKINKKFISLEDQDVKEINVHLKEVLDKLILIMKSQNPLFKQTYKRIVWTGSFYKNTKVGLPDEFDLNLVIKLPIEEENIKFHRNLPGYVKIQTNIHKNDTLNMDPTAHRELMSFIDDQAYLNQDKFRRWIERILSKIATNQNNTIELEDYTVTVRKSGPAFTLSLRIPGRECINIDLVPILAFSSRRHPPPYSRNYMLQNYDRDWFVVPKPLNNKDIPDAKQNLYWRLSFYEFEKDILSTHGRAKLIIRYLKKFRDTQNWKCIASYYIETLCLHNLHIFERQESSTSLFFTMLKQLYEAFHNGCMKHYWCEKVNLFEKIKEDEMINIRGRLSNIIKNIEKLIKEKPDDKFAIATYILNSEEIARLKYESELEVEPEAEQEESNASQWNCIIV